MLLIASDACMASCWLSWVKISLLWQSAIFLCIICKPLYRVPFTYFCPNICLLNFGLSITAQVTGNFPTVTRVLLSKIPPVDGRMTYVYDEYTVIFKHIYASCSYIKTIVLIMQLVNIESSTIYLWQTNHIIVSLRSRRRDMLSVHVRHPTAYPSRTLRLPPRN